MSDHRHHDAVRLGHLSGLAFALLAVIGLGGCGAEPPPADETSAATRIVSLAPHLTELAFAAGVGDRVVGTVEFSDEPAAARAIPRIGDAFRLDHEAIAALRPDLVLGWPSGNSPTTIARLERSGYEVLALEPRRLEDISAHIRLIGRVAGVEAVAERSAAAFDAGLAELRATYGSGEPLRVFYQVAPEPLMTIGGRHFITRILEVCGARSVFANLDGDAVTVGREDVLTAAPDLIIANDFTPGSAEATRASPLADWRSWPHLTAVSLDLLFVVDPALTSVPGPRLLAGAEQICVCVETARKKLGAARAAQPPSG